MITGEDFIHLAGKLVASQQPGEAACRTAISRAYYGAFHLVKQYLGSLDLKVTRNHGELQRWLLESGHERARAVGGLLVDLHHSRIRADYDLTKTDVNESGFARECVEVASDLRAILHELDNSAVRAQVKAGIEAYWQRIKR
jgi:hypothetical protein